MVDYFKEALQNDGGKVFAINSHLNAPALFVADDYAVAPPIHSEGYVEFLIDYCIKNQIDLIVPLLDNDLPVLAKNKARFDSKGIYTLAPEEWVALLANDKFKTFQFLKDQGFETVPTYCDLEDFYTAKQKGEIDFPVIIKPRWGMGSLSVYLVENQEELDFYFKKAQREITNSFLKYESSQDPGRELLIMAYVTGEEYMLDILNDLDGNYQVTVVNRKLLRKGGETEAVETVKHEELEALGQKISKIFRFPLVMDADVFWTNGKAYILEFNPRFSGGYPFSHHAGIHLPKALIKWLKGEVVDPTLYLTPRIGSKAVKGITIITRE